MKYKYKQYKDKYNEHVRTIQGKHQDNTRKRKELARTIQGEYKGHHGKIPGTYQENTRNI